MLGIMLQKMWHKKWMNLSLLLGCILLVATVVSFPLYEKAAYDRMLQDEFRNYISTEGSYPAMLNIKNMSKNEQHGTTIDKIEDFQNGLCSDLGVTPRRIMQFYFLLNSPVTSELNREDAENTSVSLGFITDLPNNVTMLTGEMYSEEGISADGAIECVVSQETLINLGLLVGETLQFNTLKTVDGEPIRILIKGVYKQNSEDPYYWQLKSNDVNLTCMINESVFRKMFTKENARKYTINCNYYVFFEYEDITNEQVPHILERTKYLTEKSKYRSVLKDPEYYDLLGEYTKKVNRISATLIILQVPVLIMLAAFLLMISSQMYEMEKNEISVIKSRGSARIQIFRLYLYQGILLTLVGGMLGVLLGSVFSRILGSVRNFLDFDTSRTLNIVFTENARNYAIGGMVVTLLMITLPAIRNSKVSIVNLKQSKNANKRAWWKKIYLDVVLLGVSLYGYYSFHKNMTNMSGNVLSGESLDPLLYLSSSLFIVGMGLLFIRIQPYVVKLIYLIGSKFWGPASYISFMETIKQGKKQQLIILFLIMTVSLGMYHSTVARTILDNAVSNTEYNDATDMILAEKWTEAVDTNGAKTGVFIEPDFKKYATMDFAEKYTRVYYDTFGYVNEEKNKNQKISIMGIHTKDFGSMTYVDKDILGKHYYEYLNELAKEPEGVILTSNFKTKYGYDIGDSFNFYNSNKALGSCKIVDFVDFWPTYAPTVTDLNPDGSSYTDDNYMAIINYDYSKKAFGLMPYEIWIDLKDDVTTEDIYNWIESNDIRVKKYVNKEDDLRLTNEDPLLQGTNGILTLGFVVTIVLCAVGYMIYWIMSIKERELIFGVLRASGFHKSEVVRMLLIEQVFTGVFAVLAGIGIGFLSSDMFVPIIQTSFASSTQVLPLRLIIDTNDLIRLYGVIGAVMLICLIVLVALLFHMNVTKALKLGEE